MATQMRLERADAADLPAIMSLVAAVNWPHRPQDVAPLLDHGVAWRAREGVDPVPGDGLLGVAMLWPFGPQAGRAGMVIVAPEAQGRGIGRRLMEKLLEEAGSRALRLLATEEGRPLYEKLGFRTIGQSQRHQGVVKMEPVADGRIGHTNGDDLAPLLALDRQAFGADRGDALRHLAAVSVVRVMRSAGKITGYAMQREFGRGRVVGPIVADSEADAIALFLASAQSGLVRVDRPLSAAGLGDALEAHGLAGHEISADMVWRDWPLSRDSGNCYAMASHAWG